MSNPNFNKQTTNARQALAIGGPATKKEISMKDMRGTGGTKEMRERKKERLKKFNHRPKGGPMLPLPVFPKKPGEAPKTFPKIPKTPRPVPLTPKQIKKLKDMMDKKRGKVAVNKTQKGGRKRTKSMMDSTRAKSLGLK